MAQQPLEMILARQLAEHLAFPVVLIGADGSLAFYNEPAEHVLGVRFEEFGALPYDDWSQRVQPFDEHGRPLAAEERPLLIAVRERRPSHARLRLGAAGGGRDVEITAIPLESQSGEFQGIFAIFWEQSA